MKSGEAKLFGCILVVAVILVAVAGIPFLIGGGPPGPPQPETPKEVSLTRNVLVPPGSHIQGDPNAPNTVVVFSDLQCGHCKTAETDLKKELEEHKGQLNVVYRHFQIAQTHDNSQILAQGAEAAGEQGKFFEMIHGIFENQDKFNAMDALQVKSELTKLAGTLKLDMLKFRSALEDDRTLKPYIRDREFGIEQRLNGTPAFFFIAKDGKVTKYPITEQIKKRLDDPKTWQ